MLSSDDEKGGRWQDDSSSSGSYNDDDDDDYHDAIARSLAVQDNSVSAAMQMQDAPAFIPAPQFSSMDEPEPEDGEGNLSYCATAPFGTEEPELSDEEGRSTSPPLGSGRRR